MDTLEDRFALLDEDFLDDTGFIDSLVLGDFSGDLLDDFLDDSTLPGTLDANFVDQATSSFQVGDAPIGKNLGAPSLCDKAKQFDIAVESLHGPRAFQAWRILCALFRELKEQKQLDLHLSRLDIQTLLHDVTCFTYKFRFVELAAKHKLFTVLRPGDACFLVDTMLDVAQHTTHGTHDCEKASNILLRAPSQLLKRADLGWMTAKLSTLDTHENSRASNYMKLVAKCFKSSKLSCQHAWQVVLFLETRAARPTSKHYARSLTSLAMLACCAATRHRLLAWARTFTHTNTSARSVFETLIYKLRNFVDYTRFPHTAF
jgi:hypothetical protein